MLVKMRRGHRVGHIAWGWHLADDGCTLERDADGAAMLQLLRELRAPGYTLRALARELNTRGIPTRRQRPWSHKFVYQLLVRHK